MTRQRCNGTENGKRCQKTFRARAIHQLCRECHRKTNQTARPIASRDIITKGYRRTKSRRGITARSVVPKVVVNRNKQRGKNATS